MTENNLVAIFAQSGMGGLYMGIEEEWVDPGYQQCSDPDCGCGEGGLPQSTPTFFRLPDDIGESELMQELKRAQQTGKIDAKYKVHNCYNGASGGIFYLMKLDKDGVQYHPGRGLVAIRQRWAKQMDLPKPRMTRAELDAAEEAEYQEYLEDKARRN